MDFSWNSATLIALFVGLVAGGFIGHSVAGDEAKKKAKRETRQKFCPHCGESIEATK